MARKASGRISRSLQKKHQEQRALDTEKEAIDPFVTGNPTLRKPPEVQRPPNALVRVGSRHHHGLPTGYSDPYAPGGIQDVDLLDPQGNSIQSLPSPQPNTLEMLEKLGGQVLVGQGAEDAHEFWIELKQEILGGLQIRISLQNKVLSATLLAPNAGVRHILKQRLPYLKDHLHSRGIRVQKLEVVIAKGAKEDE
ncbi:MAG: flagellar hook-length control protein FliK [Myxococcales bacterium]|nr:flagellar hook-length control protein FliK [Myxococcales bacterium]MCB9644326.1 flagellar hook-length control protein FliK [Myxococcales bacterium]